MKVEGSKCEKHLTFNFQFEYTGVAQLVEHRSPKPGVGSSSLSARAKIKKMKIANYIKESYDELVHKVSWPTRSELTNSAIVVLIASVIIALIVFAMDKLIQLLMDFIYGLLF